MRGRFGISVDKACSLNDTSPSLALNRANTLSLSQSQPFLNLITLHISSRSQDNQSTIVSYGFFMSNTTWYVKVRSIMLAISRLRRKPWFTFLVLLALVLALSSSIAIHAFAGAAPSTKANISLSVHIGPPTSQIKVNGSAFGARTIVEFYSDE